MRPETVLNRKVRVTVDSTGRTSTASALGLVLVTCSAVTISKRPAEKLPPWMVTMVRSVTVAPAWIWPVEVIVFIEALLIVPEPGFSSSTALTEPDRMLMAMPVIVPCPAAVIAPAAVPTDIPEMLLVDTIPVEVMELMVVLLITPEAGFWAGGAVNEPERVAMLTVVVVPCPAAMMEAAAVPTDIPEMLPVETIPVEVMVVIVVLLITPEPGFWSSGAVNEPDRVPMLTLVVVPCPAAVIAPAASPTDIPEMCPVETVPVEVMELMVVLLITPEPGFWSSGAVNEPEDRKSVV